MRLLIIAILTQVILFLSVLPASAALVPCGNLGQKACTFCDFFKLAQNIIDFSITSIALPLAGLFFLIGAFLIMVSGSVAFTEWSGKGGQELHSLGGRAITGALIGVLIVLAAWLFINELLNFIVDPRVFPLPWNEIQCKAEAPPGPVVAAPPPVPDDETEMRKLLRQYNVSVNKNPCPPGKRYQDVPGGCTNVAGLPTSAVEDLKSIAAACGSIMLTGGTEIGHRSHGPGRPVMDLSFTPCVAQYITQNRSALGIDRVCTTPGDSQYRYGCSYDEAVRHLHIEI